jgi:hypothetical protein
MPIPAPSRAAPAETQDTAGTGTATLGPRVVAIPSGAGIATGYEYPPKCAGGADAAYGYTAGASGCAG